jgi:hypothetical protein
MRERGELQVRERERERERQQLQQAHVIPASSSLYLSLSLFLSILSSLLFLSFWSLYLLSVAPLPFFFPVLIN